MPQRRATRRAATAVGVLVVLSLALGAWLLLRDGAEPDGPRAYVPPERVVLPTAPAVRARPAADPACPAWPRRSFEPTSVDLRGVARGVTVRGFPRDAAGVPGVPPVADKAVVAWDLGGIEPGSTTGQVLLNAHTWPDGSALGNRLLDRLQVGGRLVLHGEGRAACYRVARRVEVREEDGFPGYGATDGLPQVLVVVCSGERLGPGRWTHRTIWVAEPVGYPEPDLPDLDDVVGAPGAG